MVQTAYSVQTIPTINGPVPVTSQRYTPAEIVEHLKSALMSPYTGSDPAKKGKSKGEAAFLSLAEAAQDGDTAALEVLLNRLLGKPVQQVNSLNVTASLSEFLGALAVEMEKENTIEVEPVDPFGD